MNTQVPINRHNSLKYKIMEFLYYPYSLLTQIDEYILNIDENITSSMDIVLDEMKISPFIRNIFKGKQIQFMFVLSINLFLIYNDFSEDWPFYIIKLIYYSNLFMLLIVIYLMYTTDPGTLNKNEEFETYIITQQPLIKQHLCNECNILKCLRSMHCPFCKKCILKYELHSKWFNRCIGSKNSFIYSVLLLICSFHFFVMYDQFNIRVVIFTLQNFYFRLYRFFFFHVWLLIMTYLTIKIMNFSKIYIKGILNNITYNERNMWKRLPYLWANMSKQYFNPFDKQSLIKNLKENIHSFVDPLIDNKNKDINEISELVDTNQIKLNLSISAEEKSLINIQTSKKNDTENQINESLSEYGFIPKDKLCYYTHYHGDQETIINWTKYRIYTLMDIHNSPMKKVIEESLKKEKSNI